MNKQATAFDNSYEEVGGVNGMYASIGKLYAKKKLAPIPCQRQILKECLKDKIFHVLLPHKIQLYFSK